MTCYPATCDFVLLKKYNDILPPADRSKHDLPVCGKIGLFATRVALTFTWHIGTLVCSKFTYKTAMRCEQRLLPLLLVQWYDRYDIRPQFWLKALSDKRRPSGFYA